MQARGDALDLNSMSMRARVSSSGGAAGAVPRFGFERVSQGAVVLWGEQA